MGTENSYDVITGREFVAGSSILVAAGGFMLILAVFGIIGAITMKKVPLIIVSLLVTGGKVCIDFIMAIIIASKYKIHVMS